MLYQKLIDSMRKFLQLLHVRLIVYNSLHYTELSESIKNNEMITGAIEE